MLSTIVLLSFLAIGILTSAVPRYLREELGAARGWTGFGTTVYFVGAILVRPTAGRLIDRWGARPFLTVPPILMAVCVGATQLVPTVWWVVVLRFLQGAVGAAYTTSAFVGSTDLAPPGRRASAVSKISVVMYVGFVVGPICADVLLDVGHAAAFLAAAGLLLAAAATARARLSPGMLGPGRATVELAGAAHPARARSFQPAVAMPGLGTLVASFLFASIVAFHPEYADRIGIARPGTLFATYAGSVLLMRRFAGDIADRWGPLHVAIPGMAIASVATGALALSSSPVMSYVAMAFTGLGAGVTFPALTADAVRRVTDAERGSAMGSFMAFGDVGQATAGPLVGVASQAFGFRWVYGFPAIAVAVGCTVLTLDAARRRAATLEPLPAT